MTLTNCGNDTDPATQVTLDGDIDPVNELSDFDIPISENTCHPVNGDNEILTLPAGGSCTSLVVFAPEGSAAHPCYTRFTSNARQPQPHNIDFLGAVLCGASSIDTGEQCDDGNTRAGGNECLANCLLDPTLIAA